MELNICYTRFLSLMFEKLLGKDYVSNDLTLVKPHTITTASFQKLLASEVPLTSHMLKVAKLSKEPEQPLIPPSGEVDANDTADKSPSRTSVQLVTQLEAPTDRMTKKRRIPPSSKPKSPYKVRVILPKKQVAETQHAEVTMVTVDATKSLASELAEEQGNQPSTAEAKKLGEVSQWQDLSRTTTFLLLVKASSQTIMMGNMNPKRNFIESKRIHFGVEKFIQKFYNISDHHKDEETGDENNPNIIDNVPEIFKIKEDVFNFDTPLCIAIFKEFNYLLKIDPDLFTYDIQGVKTYDEYEQELNNEKTQGLDEQWSKNGVPYQLSNHICEPYRFKNGITKWPTCSLDTDGYCNGGELPGMVRVSRMTYFQDHKWYDKMIDGGLKQETLKYKAQIKESWGDATPGVMKFCAWVKNNFEKFHELDYDVLVKLEECWWRVNTNEVCLFTRWDDRLQGPYANAKPKWTFNPYLNVNSQPEWNNKTNNEENFQIGQKCMENLTHEPLPCKIRSNYGVTCEDEAKRRNSRTKTKTFEEICYLLLYAVSNKEDTAMLYADALIFTGLFVSRSYEEEPYDNDSAERQSLPDHMDHICEEVTSLHLKLRDREFFIIHQVSAKIKSSLPVLVTTTLQEQLPGLLSATLKDYLPSILQESLQTHIPATDRFARLETELSKTLKSDMRKSVTSLVKSGMKEVKDDLNSQTKSLGKLWEHQSAETLVESQREQPADVKVANKESTPLASDNKPNEDDNQPLSKRFKILTPIPDIPNLTPLNTFVPEHLLKSKEQQKSIQEFTDQLFKTTSLRFLPTPPKEPTPPRYSSKGKAFAIIEEPGKEIRISDLKAKKEKSEQELRKLLNPATLKAQAHKWTKHKAKKANMMEEYNHQISYRADPLPITKISYVVNSRKEATMKITRGNNPLNLIVHPNFRLKTLGFSEWLEAKRLGLPPPPKLATFRLTAEEKKRKRTEFIKEVFLTKDVRVDGMDKNLIPPHGVLPSTNLSKEDQLSAKHQLAVKGLSECKALESNIRRIQVKDIVKEVEDYLKPYSSARMDIIRIASLDLEKEIYGEALQPEYDEGDKLIDLGVWGEWLCVLYMYFEIFDDLSVMKVDVWAMKVYGMKDSWTKLVSIPHQYLWMQHISRPLCISNDGKELLSDRLKWFVHDCVNSSCLEIQNFDRYHEACIVVQSLVSPFPL
ncbi:hypothetical protein Tco_0340551 [Tanacetum coccineum]